MEGSDNLQSSGWHLKCFLFQVKQKKYEVLDEHKKKSSLNGLVRITTVTNSLSVANSKEYSQVSSAHIITNTALQLYPRHHASIISIKGASCPGFPAVCRFCHVQYPPVCFFFAWHRNAADLDRVLRPRYLYLYIVPQKCWHKRLRTPGKNMRL